MFIGHYGVSFAAKQKTIPLWLLFVAVQFLDVVWSVLVMLGAEKLRITPGISRANALDLYYMPYTHSLMGALALSALFGGISAWFFRDRRARVFWLTGAAVFSHWLLDLMVHIPDMPLFGDTLKVGFGLWNFPWISLPLELASLWAGALLYARKVPVRKPLRRCRALGICEYPQCGRTLHLVRSLASLARGGSAYRTWRLSGTCGPCWRCGLGALARRTGS